VLIYALQDSFYKSLTPEQSKRAFNNDWDFDRPEAIDFDVLVERLYDLKQGCVVLLILCVAILY
jgi:uridine kinase